MLSPVLIAAYAVFPAHAGMIPTSSPNHHPSVFPARGSMPRRWNGGGTSPRNRINMQPCAETFW